MEIIKRNGERRPYEAEKIGRAIRAAFDSVPASPHTDIGKIVDSLTMEIEGDIKDLSKNGNLVQVETIQDLVEKTLIEHNYYAEVKNFILYRVDRTKKRDARKTIEQSFPTIDVRSVLLEVQNDFTEDEYNLNLLSHKFHSFKKNDMSERECLNLLIKAAVELTAQEAPRWELIASRLLMLSFTEELSVELEKRNIHSFYEKISYLEENGLYGDYIRKHYTKEELETAFSYIDTERNKLLTYSSLDMLLRRYVIRTRGHIPLETPQEMFLGIALHLAMLEKEKRMYWVKQFYDMLSKLQVTMATPTISNARKPYHQLSSCFIDTVPDSLDGIYRSIDNFAKISKFGGGMGLYFGKVRAVGSPIRGFQGAAGGIIRWIKLANDTAVAVDQLGVRQGSVAVYLDIWHKDVPEFLQLRTNNGDDRMKAHDVFPAICYPDLFWKTVRDDINASWYLMCPHEILSVKGYSLEDYFGDEWEKRYKDCVQDSRISKREIPIKELVRLILKSAVETGTPFAFYRDAANKTNPNGHKGMIYCSNLCTEIAQNMSPIQSQSQEIKTVDGETVVVTTTKPGDFVVCNLASLVLGNIEVTDRKELQRIVYSVVRALDNVIDLNYYPVPYAKITNGQYRAIGLGTSGYHHMLAKQNIAWESEEHLRFVDKVFEDINFAAIEASMQIAKEKGSYLYFEGSDWQTGAYFTKRNYTSERWQALQKEVQTSGMRNGYLLAIAPTSSTSIIAGTTAGTDPVMKRYFLEEKKGALMPRVAPALSMKTFWLYKNARLIDQEWSMRAAGVRQRHVDQAQSVNLYITTDYTFKKVLGLYLKAWEEGVKSIYYVRSQSLEVEECETCSS
ncbi:ribonucleoside-diphosphate reductase subunit alpha [Treponema phagedenis]|uniref:Ribonucleoside-diphosphate reductase n=1 Tax=Treponema phagedenis TaxID=162 RepID=A0A0B7GUI2_TREPH|nr:ribonucleoside-diphosphate reductase subunit alpha [Treponema phagedenis]QSI00134.1 ribonucleoside-diphosphate reductase subunit alpha [Treponema phagedenis]CEM62329.1 Ribonucleoside-diphosphate reductase subunit alpha [Treponema phagedenis]